MSRRGLLAFLAALAASPASIAQPRRSRRIGFLAADSRQSFMESGRYAAFIQGMRDLGYVEGRDYIVDGRFADKGEQLPALAAELVQLKVDLIVTAGSDAGRAAQRATTMIPIVLATAADPIGSGLVASLARPGANITGHSLITSDLGPKQLEILKAVMPKISRVGILLNPDNAGHPALLQSLLAAGQKTGITIVPVDARSPADIERAFSTLTRERADGLIVAVDLIFFAQRKTIAESAVKRKMASVFGYREPVAAGGLLSYGHDLPAFYRHAATYVDKIFKGAKPGELPVEQPTKLELVLNVKTAKALGITFPPSVLSRADEVIK